MSGGKKDEKNGINEDPLGQNHEFLKHHKEIFLDGDVYCQETIERIEKDCNCEVICNPHFNGISFYVENKFHEDVQLVIEKVHEEERLRKQNEQHQAKRRGELTRKIRQQRAAKAAECESPDFNDMQFVEKCLKTLKMKDYVRESEAIKYRQLWARYPEYFRLVGWPEDVEGRPAKIYLNSTLLKKI